MSIGSASGHARPGTTTASTTSTSHAQPAERGKKRTPDSGEMTMTSGLSPSLQQPVRETKVRSHPLLADFTPFAIYSLPRESIRQTGTAPTQVLEKIPYSMDGAGSIKTSNAKFGDQVPGGLDLSTPAQGIVVASEHLEVSQLSTTSTPGEYVSQPKPVTDITSIRRYAEMTPRRMTDWLVPGRDHVTIQGSSYLYLGSGMRDGAFCVKVRDIHSQLAHDSVTHADRPGEYWVDAGACTNTLFQSFDMLENFTEPFNRATVLGTEEVVFMKARTIDGQQMVEVGSLSPSAALQEASDRSEQATRALITPSGHARMSIYCIPFEKAGLRLGEPPQPSLHNGWLLAMLKPDESVISVNGALHVVRAVGTRSLDISRTLDSKSVTRSYTPAIGQSVRVVSGDFMVASQAGLLKGDDMVNGIKLGKGTTLGTFPDHVRGISVLHLNGREYIFPLPVSRNLALAPSASHYLTPEQIGQLPGGTRLRVDYPLKAPTFATAAELTKSGIATGGKAGLEPLPLAQLLGMPKGTPLRVDGHPATFQDIMERGMRVQSATDNPLLGERVEPHSLPKKDDKGDAVVKDGRVVKEEVFFHLVDFHTKPISRDPIAQAMGQQEPV